MFCAPQNETRDSSNVHESMRMRFLTVLGNKTSASRRRALPNNHTLSERVCCSPPGSVWHRHLRFSVASGWICCASWSAYIYFICARISAKTKRIRSGVCRRRETRPRPRHTHTQRYTLQTNEPIKYTHSRERDTHITHHNRCRFVILQLCETMRRTHE